MRPRMASQWWETKGTKNKQRENLGWGPNDEKSKEQTNKLSVDLPFCPPCTCPIRYLSGTLQQFLSGPLGTTLSPLRHHPRPT